MYLKMAKLIYTDVYDLVHGMAPFVSKVLQEVRKTVKRARLFGFILSQGIVNFNVLSQHFRLLYLEITAHLKLPFTLDPLKTIVCPSVAPRFGIDLTS
jgi:hypothetical protein